MTEGDVFHDEGGALLVSESPEGVARVKEARRRLRAGDYSKAMEVYRELVEDFPEDRELRRHVLMVAFKRGDYREVVEQSLGLADICFAEGDTLTGMEHYSEILRLPELVAGEKGDKASEQVASLVEPLKADIYFVFGDHYLNMGRADLAIQYLDVSERLQKGRWETHWGRGQALLLKGEKAEAIESLKASIHCAPSEAAQAYELLGEVLVGESRPLDEVKPYFVKASEIFEAYECYDDALRMSFRWLQIDPQDRDMADRAREMTKRIHSS